MPRLTWPPRSGRWLARRRHPARLVVAALAGLLFGYLAGRACQPERSEAACAPLAEALTGALGDLQEQAAALQEAREGAVAAVAELEALRALRRAAVVRTLDLVKEFPELLDRRGRLKVKRPVPPIPHRVPAGPLPAGLELAAGPKLAEASRQD